MKLNMNDYKKDRGVLYFYDKKLFCHKSNVKYKKIIILKHKFDNNKYNINNINNE